MRNILLIGSGKSSNHLIRFLLQNASTENLFLRIASLYPEEILSKINNHARAEAVQLDITNHEELNQLISTADIVISMLPAHLHISVATCCLANSKNLVTASYVSPEMKNLHKEVQNKGLLFLNECGLDPGLDHMSSMQLIHSIQEKGGIINSYQSYCGGLVAPESDSNPWNYKFTWNPRNVVLAGQGPAAQYLENSQTKFLPYQRLFNNTQDFKINNLDYEGYPNRNSTTYTSTYGLDNVQTMMRGTLRRQGYSKAWNIFVQIGLTDDSYIIPNSENLTALDFISLFLPETKNIIHGIELAINRVLSTDEINKINSLDFVENQTKLNIKNASPAQILEYLLIQKWSLQPQDKDMVVMNHLISYQIDNESKTIQSQLEVIGEDANFTAMSKTVGLPLGISTLMILNKKIQLTGVHIPIHKEIYTPILEELQNQGILFKESFV